MRRILNILNNSLTAIHNLLNNNLFLIILFYISFILFYWLFYYILTNPQMYDSFYLIKNFICFTIVYLITVYREINKDNKLNIMKSISLLRKRLGNTDNLFTIIILSLCLIGFLYFNPLSLTTIYCQGDDDDVTIKESSTNDSNNKDSYNFNISKDFVQEGIQTIANTATDSIPKVAGYLAAAKVGIAVLNSTPNLPPLQRAALTIGSSGGAALAINLGGTLGHELGKSILNSKENKTNIENKIEDIINDTKKSSILDINFDHLSSLERFINYGILINLLILFHFILILGILFNKYYTNKMRTVASTNLINKFISEENLTKLNNFISKTGKYTNMYLSILIIINILIILFYILCNLSIFIVLNNHLDDLIDNYQKWNKKP